jgi:hypothetical protein
MPLTTDDLLALCNEVIKMINVDLGILPTNRLPIRKQDSENIANPSAYGSEAVICDPWARRSYKASDFFIERDLYRPAAPTDLFNHGSYLKGKPTLYHSYIPEIIDLSDKPAPSL